MPQEMTSTEVRHQAKCDIPRQISNTDQSSEDAVAAALREFFAGAQRVAVMGIGSRLRGDDAAGLLTAALLRRAIARHPMHVQTLVVSGDTAPENVTGEIKRFKPTHLLILDAADTRRQPGHLEQVDPDSLSSNLSANSHALPIKMVIEYIVNFVPCKVTIVGIQPETIQFRQRVTGTVREASRRASRMIAGVLASIA